MHSAAACAPSTRPIWDVFCRVVDNHGDAGVAWRLAADLASRGIRVRLWIDDARALAWMAPQGCAGVDVFRWPAIDSPVCVLAEAPAEVVIETFGCGLPEACLSQMAEADATGHAPLWINLEYLSAEPYVERSHLLPSLQAHGTARGLTTHFFYPGFTGRTGGLLRERDLIARQQAFSRDRWLADHGIAPLPDERLVSLFCYDNPQLPALLESLAARPTLLLTTPGYATDQVNRTLFEHGSAGGGLRAQPLPWLSQSDYDCLLWSCDINFVRGEDSLVRAIWAAVPFIWQIYPQDDSVHHVKLDAFLRKAWPSLLGASAEAARAAFRHWNASQSDSEGPPQTHAWDILNCSQSMSEWREAAIGWRDQLCRQPDLVTQLMAFTRALQAGEAAKI